MQVFMQRSGFKRRAMRRSFISSVVRMIHSSDADEAENAVQLAHWLIRCGDNTPMMLECECVEALGRHLKSHLIHAPIAAQSLGLLVYWHEDGRKIPLDSGMIPKLVAMTAIVNPTDAGEAVYALYNIARGTLSCKLACVRAGAAQVVLSLKHSAQAFSAH